MDPAEILDWDSTFFGVRVARVTDFIGDSGDALLAWSRAAEIDCLYLTLPADQTVRIGAAESLGFRVMGIRIDLRNTPPRKSAPQAHIRSAVDGDIPALVTIARTAHTDTRFFADPHFSDDRCADLYASWIANSCRGYADRVLVADRAGSAVGYCTLHFESRERGRIGLIAVAHDMRGQGLGGSLVRAALNECHDNGIGQVSVATQGGNTAALQLYERQSFRIAEVGLSMHLWMADV